MRKIVIFDTGTGGEMFAEYVERELAIVDVVRELHYELDPRCSVGEICVAVEAALLRHIGQADVIVLASYEVTLAALGYLQRKYPRQKFIGFRPRLSRRLGKLRDGRRVMLVASNVVQRSAAYSRELAELDRFKVVESEHDEWTDVEAGRASVADLRKECRKTGKVDAILVYCTDYRYLRRTFEQMYGWQVKIIDDYEGVFRDTCLALGLRGIDGGRARF